MKEVSDFKPTESQIKRLEQLNERFSNSFSVYIHSSEGGGIGGLGFGGSRSFSLGQQKETPPPELLEKALQMKEKNSKFQKISKFSITNTNSFSKPQTGLSSAIEKNKEVVKKLCDTQCTLDFKGFSDNFPEYAEFKKKRAEKIDKGEPPGMIRGLKSNEVDSKPGINKTYNSRDSKIEKDYFKLLNTLTEKLLSLQNDVELLDEWVSSSEQALEKPK